MLHSQESSAAARMRLPSFIAQYTVLLSLRAPTALSLHRLLSSSLLLNSEEEEKHYSCLLQQCALTSDLRLGAALHSLLLKSPLLSSSLFLQNHLLNMYLKSCSDISLSLQFLDEMPHRNHVTWSATIAGLVQRGHPNQALFFFNEMLRRSIRPNEFALVNALQAGSLSPGSSQARQVFGQVVRLGFESNLFLINAFLMALIRNDAFEEAQELFEKTPFRNVGTWNTMIAGYQQSQFDRLIIWDLWCQMNQEGVIPDEYSFSSVLTGLSTCSSLKNALQIHAQLVKHGFGDDKCVGNSLVDMYLQNRNLDDGFKAFDEMPQRDVASWTQMAAGYLHCGRPSEALHTISLMKSSGFSPNKFTLATELNACASTSSLEQGKKAHGFKIKLSIEMDECVDNALIDMYSKCGCMKEACTVFFAMRERSVISWTTIIMGFAQNGLAQEAIKAFEQMIKSKVKPNVITFTCLLYACSQGGFIDEGLSYFLSLEKDYGICPREDHYCCMVDLLGKAGRLQEAEDLILALSSQATALIWQTLLGACRLHGELEMGRRVAEKVLSLEKNDSSTFVLLSNMFAKSSNWDEAKGVRELMGYSDVKRVPGSSWTCDIDNRGALG